ncbi:sm-like protein LSM2 [Populus alba x Populus x berolinensis]|nr:sm-like protein LSM2 [Populus alba x Populus x berolinensis]
MFYHVWIFLTTLWKEIYGTCRLNPCVIVNCENPSWDEHFCVPVAHPVVKVEFHVKDNDVLGVQLIGAVEIPIEKRESRACNRGPKSQQSKQSQEDIHNADRLEIMLFFSYFKDLVGKEVTVELKNDLAIRGTLHSVDQYLNIKLENTRVVDQDKYPHMLSVRNCFIRGSVVRYVQLPPEGVDVDLLHDATRREARGG